MDGIPDITWGTPPNNYEGGGQPGRFERTLLEVATHQFNHPEEWALIAEYASRETAYVTAHSLRLRYPKFEFRGRQTDTKSGEVWAKYVGDV